VIIDRRARPASQKRSNRTMCDSVSKRLDERLTVVDPSGPEENAKFACKPDRRSRVAGRGIDQPDPVRDRVCPAPPR